MVAPGCTKREPWPASMMPAAMRSRLDLPEPLRPTKHTRSPAETASSAPCSNGVPPKVSAILLSCRRGGDCAIEVRGRRRDGSIAQQPRPVLLPGGGRCAKPQVDRPPTLVLAIDQAEVFGLRRIWLDLAPVYARPRPKAVLMSRCEGANASRPAS